MGTQMTFARKASGLVRGLSFIDAFGVGFMNQGLTPSMWVMISLGLGALLGFLGIGYWTGMAILTGWIGVILLL